MDDVSAVAIIDARAQRDYEAKMSSRRTDNVFDVIIFGIILLVGFAGALIIMQKHHVSAAVTAGFVLQINGPISDADGNPIGFGPFVVIKDNGTIVGRGWTRNNRYELNLSEGWDAEGSLKIAIGNRKEEFMYCAIVEVDAIKKASTGPAIECSMHCVQTGPVMFCKPKEDKRKVKFDG